VAFLGSAICFFLFILLVCRYHCARENPDEKAKGKVFDKRLGSVGRQSKRKKGNKSAKITASSKRGGGHSVRFCFLFDIENGIIVPVIFASLIFVLVTYQHQSL